MRLLLLEDDVTLGATLSDFLRGDHVVDWCRRLGDVAALQQEPYDMLIVAWQLPDGTAVDWVRSLRRAGNATPALMLNTRDVPSDRVRGLDSGADDCMATPLDPEELAARIRAVRRRKSGFGSPRVGFGAVELDLNAKTAFVNGTRAELTAREWSVLEALALRTGRVVTKRDLEALVLGMEGDLSSNAIEVHVSRIRSKLGRALIETVRGIGYRMAS
ncbi:MAG TPA: response regulator transcription factor [Burkholderiaceae bacterium]|nr:response regulator transcription factor [Burkholderiaceae bacterium]